MLTNYRFAPAALATLVTAKAAGLKANRGLSDLLGFGIGVIVDRLAKDRMRYRDYGPYWWALKDVLRAHGHDFGDQSDPLIERVYRGGSDLETVIAADEFRTDYLRTQAVGTNRFMLDPTTGEDYVLVDGDMEEPQ